MNEIATVNDLTQARLNALFDLKEWQKLLIHFDLAPDSFAFIPVIVPDSSWAELCEKALADFLRIAEKKKLQVISLKKPEQLKNLANKLFNLKPTKNLGAIWITAPIPFKKEELEEWQTAWREGMARLNQYRNPFREKFDVPVLLVGAEWIKEITRNMAPDLWSVLTILVRIEPPVISVGELQKAETAIVTQQFEGWRGVDPYYALQEAERLRGKKGQKIGLTRLLFRAAYGFDARAKYREALQSSTEAAEIIVEIFNSSTGKDKNEVESIYADILIIKGISLWNLNKLNEAIAEFDKAIEIREKLLKAGRSELSNDLAMAYLNKGVALASLGKLNEAIAEYDKAIEIFEKFVSRQERVELGNNLAMAYMNKGNVLSTLNKLNEAIAEFDKAIEICEKLLKAGRSELSNDLAASYLNKGVALRNLGKLNEAIAEYDKAIEIREKLLKAGRSELSSNLAMAYMNKGVALANFGKLNEAIQIYGQAINLWEDSLQHDELQNLPNLIKVYRNRIKVSIKIEDWETTALDTLKILMLGLPVLQNDEFSEHFKDLIRGNIGSLLSMLCEVLPDNREEIYKNAGETGDIIRQYVEDFGKNQADSTK